ncbi:MAG: polynucleotide adenylyltransferase PcnB [Vicinamibacteria bacterium]|nr:polynucleotide adenylyltransferase PcnB [Vicinamibacteria bacterium]
MAPRVLPRSEHPISRRNIDPDALKVLYRLKNFGYLGYLVGGGVRDLMLARTPKDFDISTSAHPNQVKRLFRNCFIVGRRFRLAHVRFGKKVVEVSTFRKLAEPEAGEDLLIKRDNTFGTPEEDAFRRDFTVNALFYDIATFSVIDYIDGLRDLESRTIRTIGDPGVRFREDPVRMLRAVALATRLSFSIDPDSVEAIRALRAEILKSSPARVLEELYKILRQGAARKTFEHLHEVGLLAYILPEADAALSRKGGELRASLDRLDAYRNEGLAAPDDLSTAVLGGTVLVPLGVSLKRAAVLAPARDHRREEAHRPQPPDPGAEARRLGVPEPEPEATMPATLALPFARRDLNQVRLVMLAQARLRAVHSDPTAVDLLAGRPYLEDALRWLEIHGAEEGRELALHWRSLDLAPATPGEVVLARDEPLDEAEAELAEAPRSTRRRRRGGRRRRGAANGAEAPETPAAVAVASDSGVADPNAAEAAEGSAEGGAPRKRRRRRRRRRPAETAGTAKVDAPEE